MVRSRIFLKALFCLNWLIIVLFWYKNSGQLIGGSTGEVLIAIGRLLGFAAANLVLMQLVLMGRIFPIEPVFGHDKLTKLHRRNGKIAICFIILHPIALVFGYQLLAGTNVVEQLLIFIRTYDKVNWAFIAYGLFIALVGSSLMIVRKKLRYELWYFVHLLMYGAIFLSFWHQIAVGEDLLSSKVFYGYWIGLYGGIALVFIEFRWIRPWYRFFKFHFFITRVERETENATSIYISGKNMETFFIRPGQFMIFRFFAKGFWWQAHPFSLSMPPRDSRAYPDGRLSGKEIRITVKAVGDFTRKLQAIPTGTKVYIEGPYGIFTEKIATREKQLLIAGGIGITPIRSLAEQMAKNKKDIILLYANRLAQDIALKKEVDDLAMHYGIKVVHILSDDSTFKGARGYLDKEKLQRFVPDLFEREVFLCGPPPMMASLIKILEESGVEKRLIHFERFEL